MSEAQEASEEFLEVNASLREGDLIYFETPAAQDRNAYLQANQVTYVVGFQADGQNFSEPPNFKVGQATSGSRPFFYASYILHSKCNCSACIDCGLWLNEQLARLSLLLLAR